MTPCGECNRGLTATKEVCTVCGGTALVDEKVDEEVVEPADTEDVETTEVSDEATKKSSKKK